MLTVTAATCGIELTGRMVTPLNKPSKPPVWCLPSSLNYSAICALIPWFVLPSISYSVTHSLIHSRIYSFIHSCTLSMYSKHSCMFAHLLVFLFSIRHIGRGVGGQGINCYYMKSATVNPQGGAGCSVRPSSPPPPPPPTLFSLGCKGCCCCY